MSTDNQADLVEKLTIAANELVDAAVEVDDAVTATTAAKTLLSEKQSAEQAARDTHATKQTALDEAVTSLKNATARVAMILLAAGFLLIAPAFGSSVSPGALDTADSHRAIPAALYRKADYKPGQPARNALKFGGLWLSRSADITRFFLGLPMEEQE